VRFLSTSCLGSSSETAVEALVSRVEDEESIFVRGGGKEAHDGLTGGSGR